MENLEDQILCQDMYRREKNFFGLSDAAQGAENASEVLCTFFKDKL